jgi:hypothetical protein
VLGNAQETQRWRGLKDLARGLPTDLSTDSGDKSGVAAIDR